MAMVVCEGNTGGETRLRSENEVEIFSHVL